MNLKERLTPLQAIASWVTSCGADWQNAWVGFGALEIFLLKATQEAPASALVIKIESVVGSISLRINLDQLQPKLVPSHLILVMNFPHLCHLTCVTFVTYVTSPVSPRRAA